jgi:bifunctional non-homologous end joining protein LigD
VIRNLPIRSRRWCGRGAARDLTLRRAGGGPLLPDGREGWPARCQNGVPRPPPPRQSAAGRVRTKHDGFRILAQRNASGVTLHTREGYDFAARFPLAAAAIAKLPVRSCLIDGEAIVCDANGLAVFDRLRPRWHSEDVILCAFGLLELNGKDMRGAPIEERKAALAKLLRRPSDGIVLNAHYTGDGAIVYKHACVLGCEGVVSKRLGSPYGAGRTDCWIKVKNPAAPAVTWEAEEDWNGKPNRKPGVNE